MEAKLVRSYKTSNGTEYTVEYKDVLYNIFPSINIACIYSFQNSKESVFIPDFINYNNKKYPITRSSEFGIGKDKISYKLKNIYVSNENNYFYSVNGILYYKDDDISYLIIYPWGKEDKIFKIPKNIKCLDFTIFRYVKNLETLIFQNHITNIFGCAIKTNIKNIILKNKQINQIKEKWKLI